MRRNVTRRVALWPCESIFVFRPEIWKSCCTAPTFVTLKVTIPRRADFLLSTNLNSLAVNLPRGQAPPLQATRPVTLTVTREGELLINQTGVTLDTLPAVLRPMLGPPGTNVIVAVDSAAPSGIVVQAMLKARDAGAEHFLFAVARK